MTLSLEKRSLSLFIYLLLLDGVAIFFFTRGFLLTRTELSVFSDCSDISNCSACLVKGFGCDLIDQSPDEVTEDRRIPAPNVEAQSSSSSKKCAKSGAAGISKQQANETGDRCWTQPAIKKAIILIIDALRFDFVAPSRNFDGEPKPWMDKLSVLQRLVEEQDSNARIFKFIADPPTTTLQRLKGLTTGGLPTFIDIGHSFGAPAIIEDNILLQLQATGKRVVMMGDDTWMQLFPTQFAKAFPFPSFNVKDLHTVDDGVICELFPALHRKDWDVLIGHFLGVDHVGHIFGVESPLMVDKLEQYNGVIENVVALLTKMSEPGGLLQDTLLIVMGDHGQTLNGDHGGGTPEEVETALFAFSTNKRSSSSLTQFLRPQCDLEDSVIGCITSLPQVDFSATMASFLGVPFPFGSVGQVNAELFELVIADPGPSTADSYDDPESLNSTLQLMERYNEVLCINSWQVKRYFEAYAAVAISGFPTQDLARLENLYTKAHSFNSVLEESRRNFRFMTNEATRTEMTRRVVDGVTEQVRTFREYLTAAASLARSQWTQFGLEWMIIGLLLLFACIAVRAAALYRLSCNDQNGWEVRLFPMKSLLLNSIGASYPIVMLVVLHPLFMRTPFYTAMIYIQKNLSVVILGVTVAASVVAYFTSGSESFSETKVKRAGYKEEVNEHKKWCRASEVNVRSVTATIFMMLHSFSLFSNSYIVAEGLVMNFLMASSGIIYLRYSFKARSKYIQAVCFLALIWILPKIHSLALFKGLKSVESQVFNKDLDSSGFNKLLLLQVLLTITTILLPLCVLTWIVSWKASKSPICAGRKWRSIRYGVAIVYVLIGVYWIILDLTSSGLLSVPEPVIRIVRLHIPRSIYIISLMILLTAASMVIRSRQGSTFRIANLTEDLVTIAAALSAGLSGTIILLMGRRGPLISMLAALEVWCLLELQTVTSASKLTELSKEDEKRTRFAEGKLSFGAIADWSLIASQLFFSTGHSCAFDGLHFSAAFIGFDDFGFYQQGLLLAIETFGASHMLPVIALPVLILGVNKLPRCQESVAGKLVVLEVSKGFLWFGILRAIIATITTASVCIQRRHLMVWGIFAPKFVFDALGLLLVDVLIISATSLFLVFRRQKLHKS